MPGLDLVGGKLVEFDILKVSKELALGLKVARVPDRLDLAILQDDDQVDAVFRIIENQKEY